MLIHLLCSHVVSLLLEINVYFRCLTILLSYLVLIVCMLLTSAFSCMLYHVFYLDLYVMLDDVLMHAVLYLTVYHIHGVDLW
jgi:hypothetical protein